MKIHRFIGTTKEILGKKYITERDIVFQINTVLKLKPGENITLTDGRGTEAHARIVGFTTGTIEVKIERTEKKGKFGLALHAYIAILKKDNLELAVQKITEIGISDITPITSDRTIKKNYNQERLEKIIKEAVEQSGQSVLPRLHTELSLREAITEAQKNSEVVIFFDEPNTEKTVNIKNKSVAFFIGPEGGWSESEKKLFKEEGVVAVSLGDTTLRGETAAIIGTFHIKQLQK